MNYFMPENLTKLHCKTSPAFIHRIKARIWVEVFINQLEEETHTRQDVNIKIKLRSKTTVSTKAEWTSSTTFCCLVILDYKNIIHKYCKNRECEQ